MRIVVVVGVLAAAATTAGAEPESAAPRRAVISTNLVDAALQTFGLALDYQVAPRVAVRGALGYDSRRFYDTDRGSDYRGGAQATGGARIFYDAPYNGPFADAELRVRAYGTHEICNTGPFDREISMCDDGWRAWSPRLLVGYQLTLASGFSVSAAAGLGYEWSERNDAGAHDNRAILAGSLRTGYAF